MAEKIYTNEDFAKAWGVKMGAVTSFLHRHGLKPTFARGGMNFYSHADFNHINTERNKIMAQLAERKREILVGARDKLADKIAADKGKSKGKQGEKATATEAKAENAQPVEGTVPSVTIADLIKEIHQRLSAVEVLTHPGVLRELIMRAVTDAINAPSPTATTATAATGKTDCQSEFNFDKPKDRKECPVCETSQTEFRYGGICAPCHETYLDVVGSVGGDALAYLSPENVPIYVKTKIGNLFHDAHVKAWREIQKNGNHA